ncbi:MAG TPA: hypothetical protein P5079_04645, partial [Elusimicrobiota bacterium]|nr:hypothetical protein [Elusimicrobiota bacterium]
GSPDVAPVRSETYFLDPVLSSLAQKGLRFRNILQEELPKIDLDGWDVVVLSNPIGLPAEAVSRLQEHLKRGKGLWITGGENVAGGALDYVSPGRFLPAVEVRSPLQVPPEMGAHPIGQVLLPQGGVEWGEVHIGRACGFEPGIETSVLLSAGAGNPVLAVGKVLGAPVAVLTTTLDRDWTNLPSKPLFPILCREVLAYLAGRSSVTGGSVLVGQPFEGTLSDPLVSKVEIARPDGAVETVSVQNKHFAYAKTDLPGFYRLSRSAAGASLGGFVVNLDRDADEGDLARLPMDKAEGLLPAENVFGVRFTENVHRAYMERLRGKDVFPQLAAAALLLFLGETVLVAFAGRRRNA